MNAQLIETLAVALACDSESGQRVLPVNALEALAEVIGRGTVTGIFTMGGYVEDDANPPPLFRYHAGKNKWTQSRVRLPSEYYENVGWIGASTTTMHDGSTLICNATDAMRDILGFIFRVEYMQPSGPIKSAMFESLGEDDAFEYACRSNASLVTLPSGSILRLGGRVDPKMYGGFPPITPNAIYDPSKKPFAPPRLTNQLSDTLGRRAGYAFGEWSALDVGMEMPWAMFCTLLRSGEVLLTGGLSPMGQTEKVRAACLIYSPATGSFKRTGEMTSPRSHHAGCVLPNGRVFVCGGVRSSLVRSTTCEEYDPLTEVWTELPPPVFGRLGHSCTLLYTGEVLIVGGWDIEQRCELYDPSTRKIREAARLPIRTAGYVTIPISE
jgi:hypothetical protein